MHPILFEIPQFEIGPWLIGPLPVRMYGLMIGIGFILGMYLASKQAKKERVNPDRILDMGIYLFLAAIVGSRAAYVLINMQEFSWNPLDVFAVWKGGLVFYGGLLAAVPTGIWYVKKNKLSVWKIADIVAPSIALGHGFKGPVHVGFADANAGLGGQLYLQAFQHHPFEQLFLERRIRRRADFLQLQLFPGFAQPLVEFAVGDDVVVDDHYDAIDVADQALRGGRCGERQRQDQA